MNIIQAMEDPNLFGSFFRGPSWRPWRAVLKALFALEPEPDDLAAFERVAGGRGWPVQVPREAYFVCGRRGGKSYIVALIATYLACFHSYREYLKPGERGTVMILAADRAQARTLMGYIRGFFAELPLLAQMVKSERAEAVDLINGVSIEITTASFRGVRGYTVVAAIADEVAFWRGENSLNPDHEIFKALRPAMLTIPNAMLLALSSPYRRGGVLWEAYRDYYGQADPNRLVIQAPSQVMNPTLPADYIADEYAKDPISAAAEYGAEFRSDVSAFLDPDWIDAAAIGENRDMAPRDGIEYAAFIDASGGKGDSYTLGIAHMEDGERVLDVIRGRAPPFQPKEVTRQFAEIAKRYGVSYVSGDKYGAEWVAQEWRDNGLGYEPSEIPRSQIYLETEGAFAAGEVVLPNHPRLVGELRALERKPRSGGRDVVDHPPNGHDDYANAACGALWMVRKEFQLTPSIREL
ncbi:MAG: hypothetical protein AAFQ22_00530 [Pseudomonadota bacterium]